MSSPVAQLSWAGGKDGLVLLTVASGDHLLLLCSPDSQGLAEARKFTWASSLYLTTFGQCPFSPWLLVPRAHRALKESCSLSSCKEE